MNEAYERSDLAHKVIYWIATAMAMVLVIGGFVFLIMVVIWLLMAARGVMFA